MTTEANGQDEQNGAQKPRIALMGEFSAGKSTLSNLLIGAKSLPVQVTATQMPPVWISQGGQPPYRVDTEGNIQPVDLNKIEEIHVEDTAYVRIYRDADLLGLCDIIDMPGISDPSMASDVWERVIHHANAVVWCTHATQAWRQSEAAVWDALPHELHEKSMLLLTRMDKITSEKDRVRLLRRVMHETKDLFANVLPISLLEALEAGDDREAWQASGAELFTQKLIEMVGDLAGSSADQPAMTARPDMTLTAVTTTEPKEEDPQASVAAGTVMPTRVSPQIGVRARARRRTRPTAQSAHAG